MDQKALTQQVIQAIRAARTQDDCDDAKFEFMFKNSIIKAVTAQVMGHLVQQQIISNSDTLHQFSSIYTELQDIICEVLLSSSYDLLAFIEVQNALEKWKDNHPAPAKPDRLSADEIVFLASLRAGKDEDDGPIPPSYESLEMEDDDDALAGGAF